MNNQKFQLGWLLFFAVLLFSSCETEQPGSESLTASDLREVKVITSGGFAAAYNILAPEYQKTQGVNLVTAYGSSSGGAIDSIPSRLSRNEEADIIILSRSSLDNLTRLGYVIPESRIDLVHSKIGMAVRSGSPIPDISTPDEFLNTLRSVSSIGYSASASGTYLSTVLWPRIGIWDEIKGKSKRILSERVATVVARGEVQIGFQQISEILPIPGVEYAGPIPEQFQKTTVFSAGILKNAKNLEEAQKLLNHLSSQRVAPTIARTGLTPVATLN